MCGQGIIQPMNELATELWYISFLYNDNITLVHVYFHLPCAYFSLKLYTPVVLCCCNACNCSMFCSSPYMSCQSNLYYLYNWCSIIFYIAIFSVYLL